MWLSALVFGALAVPCVTAKTHVLLLDVSGSMKARYDNNLRNWLIQPLLTSVAFEPGDRVIVRWFDHRGNTTFNPTDPQRKYDERFDEQAVLNVIPTVATGTDTDIPEALDLTLQDLEKLGVSGDVLIWIITDNEQDVGGGGSVDPFYDKIKDDPKFISAYLFPLIKENGNRVAPDKGAMVLYLLQFSAKPTRPALERIADSVGQKVGNPPVTWFPIEKGIDLNESSIQVNDEPAVMVDGRLKLTDIPEGAKPDFVIRFPFDSKLRNLKIIRSKLRPSHPSAQLPDSVLVDGDANSWRGDITPTDLTIEPGKQSATYTTRISGDMSLHPSSFWNAVWNSMSDPVAMNFSYKLEDVDTQIDLSGLDQVKNLQNITGKLRQSQKNVRQTPIPMSFQVQFNSLWRRLVVVALGLLMVGAIAGGAGLLLTKSRYQMSTPFGDQVVSLPIIGQSFVTINGNRAAIIRKRFGQLSVLPLGNYTINGSLQRLKLSNAVNSFAVDNQSEGKRYAYTLSPIARAGPQRSVRKDDFLD